MKQKTSIGTENYFDTVNRGTIFDKVKISNNYKKYSDFTKQIVKNAMDALAEIYSDIISNRRTIKFLDSSSRDKVVKMVENIDNLHKLTSQSVRISADTIKSFINNNCSRNSYSISSIEQIGNEIIKNNPLKLNEREVKELISKALNSGTSAGNNKEQKIQLWIMARNQQERI